MEYEDGYRLKTLQNYLEVLHLSIRNGLDVQGYLVWLFLDVLEFLFVNRIRYGLGSVDINNKGRTRHIRNCACWYSSFLNGGELYSLLPSGKVRKVWYYISRNTWNCLELVNHACIQNVRRMLEMKDAYSQASSSRSPPSSLAGRPHGARARRHQRGPRLCPRPRRRSHLPHPPPLGRPGRHMLWCLQTWSEDPRPSCNCQGKLVKFLL